jgi:hypothetical protein
LISIQSLGDESGELRGTIKSPPLARSRDVGVGGFLFETPGHGDLWEFKGGSDGAAKEASEEETGGGGADERVHGRGSKGGTRGRDEDIHLLTDI